MSKTEEKHVKQNKCIESPVRIHFLVLTAVTVTHISYLYTSNGPWSP